MTKLTFSFLFLLFFMSGISCSHHDSIEFLKLQYVTGADILPYRFLKPSKVDGGETYPLVIFLHGSGERGNDNKKNIEQIRGVFTSKSSRAKFPCFVIAPQCPEESQWIESYAGAFFDKPTKPMQQFIDLLEKILEENPIDTSRIYVTGLSMGGFGTWDLISRFPNKFAAAVPICGGGEVSMAPRIKHIPIWAFHGAKDNIVLPEKSRKMIMALRDAGGIPGYTEYPDVGHNSWVHAYQDPFLLPWLFKQKF